MVISTALVTLIAVSSIDYFYTPHLWPLTIVLQQSLMTYVQLPIDSQLKFTTNG